MQSSIVRRWRPAVIALSLVVLMVPFLADAALGTTRVDWGTKASMPPPRYSLGVAAAANGKIYAFGGNLGSSLTGSVREYDPVANT